MIKILNKINGPKDVKKLTQEELEVLAEDIREGLFNRLTNLGGHFENIEKFTQTFRYSHKKIKL